MGRMWPLPLSDERLLWPQCHQGTPDPGWLRMQWTQPVGARGTATGMAWSSLGPQHWGALPPESGNTGWRHSFPFPAWQVSPSPGRAWVCKTGTGYSRPWDPDCSHGLQGEHAVPAEPHGPICKVGACFLVVKSPGTPGARPASWSLDTEASRVGRLQEGCEPRGSSRRDRAPPVRTLSALSFTVLGGSLFLDSLKRASWTAPPLWLGTHTAR